MTSHPGTVKRRLLAEFWLAGVSAVAGRAVTEKALRAEAPFAPDQLIAIGKAACDMCAGALQVLDRSIPALVISKDSCGDELSADPRVTCLRGDHPLPGEKSLVAGAALLRTVSAMDESSRLLMLVSGGASSLAEALAGSTLAELQQMNRQLQGSGATIAELNAARTRCSAIKGGKLLQAFRGRELRSYAISDVQGDSIEVIGSGIGSVRLAGGEASSTVIANNGMARQAVEDAAQRAGFTIRHNVESMFGDVDAIADNLAQSLIDAPAGMYLWGGEPTVRLPANPGRGGRNLSLALALAIRLQGSRDISVLVAGTDGDDGNSGVAGAFIDGATVEDPAEAMRALAAADAGHWLAGRESLFDPGATGTNVMDIVVAMVGDGK